MSTDTRFEKGKSKASHISLSVAVAAAVLTPGAYLLGLSYHQGYLSAFGVEPDGFPISAPDVYMLSYQAVGYFLLALGKLSLNVVNKVFSFPFAYWLIAIIVGLVGGVYLFLRLSHAAHHLKTQKFLEKLMAVASRFHWKKSYLTKSVGIVGLASYSASLVAALAIAVPASWWLLPMAAYSKGHSVAEDKIQLFLEGGCHKKSKEKWDNCLAALDEKGNVLHEGLMIAIAEKEFAIFKKDGSYVIPRKEGMVLKRSRY